MASPIDTLKNSLFDQLKSYGDTVHDVFEQRIARPLLALKRDFKRPPSTTRNVCEHESRIPSDEISSTKQQESEISSSISTEADDIQANTSFMTILDKVKYTLSPPTTKRCTSEISSIEEVTKPNTEYRHRSISSLTKKNHSRNVMRHKSVSFAENSIQYHDDNENNTINQYSINDETEVLDNDNILSHHLLTSQIDKRVINPMYSSDTLLELDDDSDDDFQRKFYQSIRPRRFSIGNSQDLIYQDLSAEIVSYVLKHALRALEKEDQDLLLEKNARDLNKNEYDEDFIDLK